MPDWWKTFGSPNLNALVEEGLRNSPGLDAANHSLSAAKEQLRAQVGSSLLPSIDLGGQADRQRALTLAGAGPPTALYNIFLGQFQAQYTSISSGRRVLRPGFGGASGQSGVATRCRAACAGGQYRDGCG